MDVDRRLAGGPCLSELWNNAGKSSGNFNQVIARISRQSFAGDFHAGAMTTFTQIQIILDRLINGEEIRMHGPFWRGKTRDEFVALSVMGLPIIVVGDPAGSNLVKALRGNAPFGRDLRVRSAPASIACLLAGHLPARKTSSTLKNGLRRAVPTVAPMYRIVLRWMQLTTSSTFATGASSTIFSCTNRLKKPTVTFSDLLATAFPYGSTLHFRVRT